ncbi:MAG: shikimate kinase [Alphaproteobacteria bacterium]|jgi:shikimate kinase|nr:shikimate kinase [Alphaproteobacteria bacterium]MCV6599756.1 shikimate kinase [Alphaproteobacteria bacterium]
MKNNVILVGLMGAGKSTVGRRLAKKLDKKFIDADREIEKAAGCSVSDIFELYGEKEFRKLEYRVISRLINDNSDYVLSTGEGAFITDEVREKINETKNLKTIWLKADVEILFDRTSRNNRRPLLEVENPKEVLKKLMNERTHIYSQADITVDSTQGHHNEVVNKIISILKEKHYDS